MELDDITCKVCGQPGIFYFKHRFKIVVVCIDCDAEMVVEEGECSSS